MIRKVQPWVQLGTPPAPALTKIIYILQQQQPLVQRIHIMKTTPVLRVVATVVLSVLGSVTADDDGEYG